MATFTERLKELRNKEGLSQAELAKQLGVAMDTISKWETGERLPRDKYYAQLAEVLDVPITYLVGVTDDPEFPQMSDEEAAAIAEEEEREELEHMIKLYQDLSLEMQSVVKITLSTMWKADRYRGKLRSQSED